MGTVFVDNLEPQSGTSLTLGASGDTVSLGSGGTITNTPAFYGELGSAQVLSRATQTKITGMTTNEVDSDTAFDGTTFAVPSGKAGKYFIFANLYGNFSDCGNDGEKIQIEIFKRDSSVVIRVRDKGIGLEENELNDIFSRFYRGDPSRTKFKKTGSGLGLSITKKIINNNKGFIKAFNHKDGGAIIETIFPCINTDF